MEIEKGKPIYICIDHNWREKIEKFRGLVTQEPLLLGPAAKNNNICMG